VNRLFESIMLTTLRPRELEVIVLLDDDDATSREIAWPDLRVRTISTQPRQPMGAMMRAGYRASQGRYVMLLNDDVIFRTDGWDARVLEAFGRFADDIALVYGNDLDQGESRPTLPFVSRVAADLMGGVCPGSYRNLHIESHLFDVFKQLSQLATDRIVYLADVIFEHMHHAVGKGAFDGTSVKPHKEHDDVLFITLDAERRHVAERLARRVAGEELTP
jgi:hypothetical protein